MSATTIQKWLKERNVDGTFSVVPASSYKNGKRWFSDTVAEDIRDEDAAILMAAAPDLREALAALLRSCEGFIPFSKDHSEAMVMAHEVLYKSAGK